MALATVADLLLRKDCRTVGVLAARGNDAVPESQLRTNPIVLQALEDATAEVVVACNFTKRYTEAELAALSGASRAILNRIVCDIAFWLLYEFRPDMRRGETYEKTEKTAQDHLERLRLGETVLTIEANLDAGLPSVVDSVAGVVIGGRSLGVRGCYDPGPAMNYFPVPVCYPGPYKASAGE